MSSIVSEIEQAIAGLEAGVSEANTGEILSVADGVAKISGLSKVMYNELVEFPGGMMGVALNLEEDEVGCV
ncbi:MAG: F0F1 ATP synthase subunit alpha, partial [Verrucomicrobiota bacterium]